MQALELKNDAQQKKNDALQKEIEVAKDLPEPTITRAEYDLKDQLIRETIMNTKQKVDENSAKLDRIESKLFEIIERQ